MDSSLVSIIIPTYYRNDYLSAAVESAKKQSHGNIEIIVVDDSGTSYAESVVTSDDNIQYIPLSENMGANAARSIGFNQSNGDYIQFLDDDDILDHQKIERQIRYIKSKKSIGVVYSGIESESGYDLPKDGFSGNVLKQALCFDLWPCMTSTMLIDREVLSQVTPLENRPGGDDLGLMIKLAKITHFDFVDQPLVIKNEISGSRGDSVGAAKGRKQIIAEYSDLYDRFPEAVRNTALAEAYHTEGRILLQNNFWSARAIIAFTRQGYYNGYTGKSIGRIVAALFGRPGWEIATLIRRCTSI